MSDHPWNSARERFQEVVMPELQKIGNEIGQAATTGNTHAKEVIRCYSLLRSSFDPMTLILLEKALENYKT